MKKFGMLVVLAFCCILSAGCGKQEKEPETEVFYDIETEAEELDFPGQFGDRFLGMQFWQGEPVLLVMRRDDGSSNIYLYRVDGSQELLLKGADGKGKYWYIDNEKSVYYVDTNNLEDHAVVKYDASGETVFKSSAGARIQDIRQAEDGKIYLLLRDGGRNPMWLAQMNPSTGEVDRVGGELELDIFTKVLGAGEDGLYCLQGSELLPEFMAIDLKDGSASEALTSRGTTYASGAGGVDVHELSYQDFRVLKDGSVEILWSGDTGGGQWNEDGRCVVERLRERKVEKIPLTMRSSYYSDWWIKQQAARFNRESEKYHVILEEYGDKREWDNTTSTAYWDEYAETTSIQMAAGKGPDLLYGDVLRDYAPGIVEKGGLEDLAPWLEQSGIRQEDYFPMTFTPWQDGEKIQGIRVSAGMTGYNMKEAVLGTGKEPGSIEELVQALLAWEGNEVFLKGYTSGELLAVLLEGTENIWGMVNWEEGSCNFEGELFGSLLEVAGRYGDDGKNQRLRLAAARTLGSLFDFDAAAERKAAKTVALGVLFDDGCHAAAAQRGVVAVNANSSNKEGAWEFICFLLGDEAQSVCADRISSYHCPVSRSAFQAWVDVQREKVAGGQTFGVNTEKWDRGEWIRNTWYYGEDSLADERIEEYLEMMDDARELPYHTSSIIEIICEEAGGYFAGNKSVDEVRASVQNRVQLYLNERQ